MHLTDSNYNSEQQQPYAIDRIWLKNYQPGVPATINPDAYSSIVHMIEETYKKYADLPAFYNLGVTLTFCELDAYTSAFAAYLQQVLKLKKGDRLAIMLPNTLQYPVVLWGALRAGLTVVNVNPLYTVPELTYQLKDSGAETIVVLANFAATVQQALPETAVKNVIVSKLGDFFSLPKSLLTDFFLKYIKKKIPDWYIAGHIKFLHALNAGKKLNLNRVEVQPHDVAFLQYTGGTTGVAKGAMLTHRNIVANVVQAEAWFSPLLEYGKEIIITALPLYHIFSLTANCFFISKIGGLNVLITNPRDVPHMIDEMSKFKFTAITGVNTLFNALLNSTKIFHLDFRALKLSLGGGMAVQKAVAEKWKKITGTVLLEAYGLTETSPCAVVNPVNLKEYNTMIGLPVSSTDACVLDDDHKPVPIGEPGELAIKGPQVMAGYWNKPEETKKVFTKDGWLLTGDIVIMNDQGFIHLLERKKDMIVVSGFNVYPNEVEDVIVRVPGVVEAAVIGVPDEHSGEVLKAFVVKNDPHITAEDIMEFCRKSLTRYKIPKFIEFRDELPKSSVGKILRRALRM